MSSFACKHCGMITDEPEIVPLPEKDKEFREIEVLAASYANKGKLIPGVYHFDEHKYNHSVTCPICLKETRFWSDIIIQSR